MNVYELMEEIINEVSLRKWKEAAKNSIEGRKEEAAKSLEVIDKGWQKYEKEARKHPEDEPQLFKLAQANDAAAYKDKERAEHAAKVAYNAPDSKHSANKFLKAAHNAEEFQMDKADYRKSAHKDEHYKKAMYARHQASMDPVKSRINEAFELMESIIKQIDKKSKKGEIGVAKALELEDKMNKNMSPEKLEQERKEELQNDAKKNKYSLEHSIRYHAVEGSKNRAYKKGKIADPKKWDTIRAEQTENKVFPSRNKKVNEAYELMEEILFELDLENKQSISPNKIKKTKKDENGEKVEVVSVADELFPYEGDAKQQFNQKILAKINDMIEGTGSLEDLIQFVRRGVGNKKVAHEGLDEAVAVLEDLYSAIKKKHGEPEYKGATSEPANKSAELIHKSEEGKGKEYAQEKEKNPDINLYNKRYQTKNTKGEKETELRSRNYRRFTDDWKLPKSDEEKVEASIKRYEKKLNKNEALDLMEEIINEVSVKRWKEAAKNSIEKRQGEEDKNNAEHSYFSGRIPKGMQKSLDKEHKERDDKLTDRTERAKYLAKNLPDSSKSAVKVKSAAEKVVKSRSTKTDKYRDAEVRNYKKSTSASKTGDEAGAAKYMDKAAESSKNRHNTLGREDHARVLANKTLRDSSAKDTKFKEVAGTNAPSVSYKEENKNTRERLEKAEKAYNKADDKKEDMYGKTEKERAAERLRNALSASNKKFSSHKV